MMFAINLWSYGGMLYYWAYQIRSEIWKKNPSTALEPKKSRLKWQLAPFSQAHPHP